MTATALIIDDEPDIRELIAMTLARMGLDYHAAANLEEARNLLKEYEFNVCLTDMRLPDGNGVEFVKYMQSAQPEMPVAVITAHGNMEAAVEAMKNGAYDFVSKPVDIKQLRNLVVQAVALNSDSAEAPMAANDSHGRDATFDQPTKALAPRPNETDDEANVNGSLQSLSGRPQDQNQTNASLELIGSDRLIGRSRPMKELRTMIAKVARTNAPVWITGESGTGKELVARLIHENGPRRSHPFVAINCGAIPNELMESELFGHKKGSFTGASHDHEGLFMRADGGTLFLDEVAELPLHMQVKLLRAIQERSIRAVGSNEEQSVDVRILSASHKDLAGEVDAGDFRHDLYYRLNVIAVACPSLRTRADDIPALADYFLSKISQQGATQSIKISSDAIGKLQSYSFPGNVRELENLLERAVALLDGNTINVEDLAFIETANANTRRSVTDSVSKKTLEPKNNLDERTQIIEILNETRWNRKAAAVKLGLTYRQLRYRIQQLGIDSQDN